MNKQSNNIKLVLLNLLTFEPFRKEELLTSCHIKTIKLIKGHNIILEKVTVVGQTFYRLKPNSKNINRVQKLLNKIET